MNNNKVRLILVSALAAGQKGLTADNIISDKLRSPKRTGTLGNWGTATFGISYMGKTATVSVIPDTDWSDNNQPYAIVQQQADGSWKQYREGSDDTEMLRVIFPQDYPAAPPSFKVTRKKTVHDLNLSYLMSRAGKALGAVSKNEPCVARCYV